MVFDPESILRAEAQGCFTVLLPSDIRTGSNGVLVPAASLLTRMKTRLRDDWQDPFLARSLPTLLTQMGFHTAQIPAIQQSVTEALRLRLIPLSFITNDGQKGRSVTSQSLQLFCTSIVDSADTVDLLFDPRPLLAPVLAEVRKAATAADAAITTGSASPLDSAISPSITALTRRVRQAMDVHLQSILEFRPCGGASRPRSRASSRHPAGFPSPPMVVLPSSAYRPSVASNLHAKICASPRNSAVSPSKQALKRGVHRVMAGQLQSIPEFRPRGGASRPALLATRDPPVSQSEPTSARRPGLPSPLMVVLPSSASQPNIASELNPSRPVLLAARDSPVSQFAAPSVHPSRQPVLWFQKPREYDTGHRACALGCQCIESCGVAPEDSSPAVLHEEGLIPVHIHQTDDVYDTVHHPCALDCQCIESCGVAPEDSGPAALHHEGLAPAYIHRSVDVSGTVRCPCALGYQCIESCGVAREDSGPAALHEEGLAPVHTHRTDDVFALSEPSPVASTQCCVQLAPESVPDISHITVKCGTTDVLTNEVPASIVCKPSATAAITTAAGKATTAVHILDLADNDPGPADTFGSPASALADTASVIQSFGVEAPVVDIELADDEPGSYLRPLAMQYDDDAGADSVLILNHAAYRATNYSAVLYLETIADEDPILKWIPCLRPIPSWLWPPLCTQTVLASAAWDHHGTLHPLCCQCIESCGHVSDVPPVSECQEYLQINDLFRDQLCALWHHRPGHVHVDPLQSVSGADEMLNSGLLCSCSDRVSVLESGGCVSGVPPVSERREYLKINHLFRAQLCALWHHRSGHMHVDLCFRHPASVGMPGVPQDQPSLSSSAMRAIQEWRKAGDMHLQQIPGIINPSDAGTKPLPWVLHHCHVWRSMGRYVFS
jgi:hypothetical protein